MIDNANLINKKVQQKKNYIIVHNMKLKNDDYYNIKFKTKDILLKISNVVNLMLIGRRAKTWPMLCGILNDNRNILFII